MSKAESCQNAYQGNLSLVRSELMIFERPRLAVLLIQPGGSLQFRPISLTRVPRRNEQGSSR